MGVRLDSVSVNGLGPISSIQWGFKDINLIYGKNERGKTFLVEYLLSSLFKNQSKTRDLTDSGQVLISGIDKSAKSFTPRGREKIDDLKIGQVGGIPIDLSRLCVVKGGELSFTGNAGGTVTKSILKEYLSDQRMLEKILEGVPAVVRETKWEDGAIIPLRHQGIIKTWKEKQQMVERITELLSAIDSEYSQGHAKQAEVDLGEVIKRIELQFRAKRMYAFHISTQIDIAVSDLDNIPQSMIEQARLIAGRIENLDIQITRSMKRIEELQPKCENYLWLKSAIEECEKRPEGLKNINRGVFIFLSMISTLVTIATAFFEPYMSLGFGILSIFFVFLALKQFQASLQGNLDRQEVVRIYEEFEIKFRIKVRSVATLKSAYEAIQPLFFELENLKNQINQLGEDLAQAENEQKHALEEIGGNEDGFTKPDLVINKAQDRRTKKLRYLEKLKLELAATQVPVGDFLKETEAIKYDQNELVALEKRQKVLEETIKAEDSLLQTLKQRVCDLTRDSMDVNWEYLIERLRTKHHEAIEESKLIHAQILGGIFITGVISDLRQREDENIYRALGSKLMMDPIKALTPAYTGVELNGEELVVFNDKQRFLLSTMSTGVKEQVLLALRIGLTSYILGDQKMFLILDDAFQHSDWDRRELLVDEMVNLAKNGWQIIYFSMDDHIKKLFEERVKPKFSEKYGFFEL
jgi:hypothetical protein